MKKALMIMYMAVAASTAQAQSPLSFYAEAGNRNFPPLRKALLL